MPRAGSQSSGAQGVARRARARAAATGRGRDRRTRRLVRGRCHRRRCAQPGRGRDTVERFGGIDVVIANAGVAPFGTVATIDPVALRTHDRGEPDRRLAHGARRAAARGRAAGLHPHDRVAGRRAAPSDARRTMQPPRPASRRSRTALRRDRPHRHPRGRRLLQLHRHRHDARRARKPGGASDARRDAGAVQQDRAAVGRGQGDRSAASSAARDKV